MPSAPWLPYSHHFSHSVVLSSAFLPPQISNSTPHRAPHPRFMIDGKQPRSGLIKDRNVDFQSQCDSVPKQLPVFSRRPSRASGEGHPLSLYATAKGNEVEGRPKSLAATLAYLPAMFLPKVTQPLSKYFHMYSTHVYRAAENY